jgi:hypothetical protein
MQHTHTVEDEDYTYPENLSVKDVHVYFDPSFLTATHDYSCPVCRENHAVLSSGVMTPCWTCRSEGWTLTQIDKRPWWKKIF